MKRRLISIALCAAMLLGAAPARAEEPEDLQPLEAASGGVQADPGEDLFLGWLESLSGRGAVLQGSSGSYLEGVNRAFYNLLVPAIAQIAAGDRSSTKIELEGRTFDSFDPPFAASDLRGNLNLRAVMSALMDDFPYALYWYDKTSGVGLQEVSISDTRFASGSVALCVSEDYLDPEAEEPLYTVNAELAQAAARTADVAQGIVNNYAGLPDYDLLWAYKMEIENRVEYNYDAASDVSMAFGNPWQLIYVFDGDPDTNVVCEGYAKAFKYLCDLTDFEGDTECHLVEGDLTTSNSSGPHMWNHVLFNGKWYLADITNCDGYEKIDLGGGRTSISYATGYPDHLFLKGVTPLPEYDGYSISFRDEGNKSVTVYYTNVESSYGDGSILSPSQEDLTEPKNFTAALTVHYLDKDGRENHWTSESNEYLSGSAVTLRIPFLEGSHIQSVETDPVVVAARDQDDRGYTITFTMPESAINIDVTFAPDEIPAPKTHTVTLTVYRETETGEDQEKFTSVSTFDAETEASVTVPGEYLKEGFRFLRDGEETDLDASGVYTFTMPDADVTLTLYYQDNTPPEPEPEKHTVFVEYYTRTEAGDTLDRDKSYDLEIEENKPVILGVPDADAARLAGYETDPAAADLMLDRDAEETGFTVIRFTMPETDVTVRIYLKGDETPQPEHYIVTLVNWWVDKDGAFAHEDPEQLPYEAGDPVSLSVPAVIQDGLFFFDAGAYVTDTGDNFDIDVEQREDGAVISFTMPEENVTIQCQYVVGVYTATVVICPKDGEQEEIQYDIPARNIPLIELPAVEDSGLPFTSAQAETASGQPVAAEVKPGDTEETENLLYLSFTMPEEDITVKIFYGGGEEPDPETYTAEVITYRVDEEETRELSTRELSSLTPEKTVSFWFPNVEFDGEEKLLYASAEAVTESGQALEVSVEESADEGGGYTASFLMPGENVTVSLYYEADETPEPKQYTPVVVVYRQEDGGEPWEHERTALDNYYAGEGVPFQILDSGRP